MIGVLGINYESSPLNVRESFSLSEDQIIKLGSSLKQRAGFSGLVVLSTCNRSEFYFQMEDFCEKAIYNYMLKSLKSFCDISIDTRDYFYYKSGDEAFKHLFHVVAGANSMILGEDQIVKQVKHALQISIDNDLSDTELTRLFSKSFEANKKIRTQTKINQGAFSVPYAGVEKCMTVFPDLKSRKILVVGTGETGRLTLKNLIKKGCQDIVITNRTYEKASVLAEKYGVKAASFDSLAAKLHESDIVIVSTSSKKALINYEEVNHSKAIRNGEKQLFIDLSVPRNVDPSVADIDNTIVYDIDQLQEIVDANQEKRKKLISEIEEIVDEYLQEFNDWLSARNLKGVISTVKSNFEMVNQTELAGFKKVNKTEDSELLDSYASHIKEKYARLLIKNIKEVTHNGRKEEYVKLLNSLFDLN